MALQVGDRVTTKGRRGVGVVEAIWVATYSYQHQPPGTAFAKVRFRGTWPRFGGGMGDSVVTKRADRFTLAESTA